MSCRNLKRTPLSRVLLFVVLACLTSGFLSAESRTSVKITSLAVLTTDENTNPVLAGYGKGRLSIQSAGSRDVKGLFAIDSQVGSTSLLDIYRAWIQVDFPSVRLTTGKARLSWGEGIYFNAGDVLYGSANLSASLTDSIFRDQARLLQAVYIPFGLFSYVEILVMPPEYNFLAALQESLEDSPDPAAAGDFRLSRCDEGFRVVSQILNIKTEAGYLYSGSGNVHKPYVSLQGHLLTDWYISVSTALGPTDPNGDFKENLKASAGIFALHSFPGDAVLTFRLETLAAPFGKWKEEPATADPGYGLFLYPEISFTPAGSLSLTLNGLYSPVDNSALLSFTGNWGVYQGLRLLGSVSVQAGERNDIYCGNRSGGISLTLGGEYLF